MDRCQSFQDLPCKPVCTLNISPVSAAIRSPALAAPFLPTHRFVSPCPQEGLARFHQRVFIEVRKDFDDIVRALSTLGRSVNPFPPTFVSAESFCGFSQVCHASVDEAAVGDESGMSSCFLQSSPQRCQLSTRSGLFAIECSQPSSRQTGRIWVLYIHVENGYSPSSSGEPYVGGGERAIQVGSVWLASPCHWPKLARAPHSTRVHRAQPSIRVVPIHAARMPNWSPL